jgi:UDP-galactopyranose mutase
MENPNHKWRFLAGKIIYKWAIYTMAMLNNQRVGGLIRGLYAVILKLQSPKMWGFSREDLKTKMCKAAGAAHRPTARMQICPKNRVGHTS